MRIARGLVIATSVVLALVVMLGAGVPSSEAHPTAGQAANSSGTPARALITDIVPLPAGVHSAGPLPSSLRLTLAMTPANAGRLVRLDHSLADPFSPLYQRFLTEPEFVAEFSPPRGNVTSVQSYFEKFGGTGFAPTPDGLGLSFVLPARQASAALGVTPEIVGSGTSGPLYDSIGRPHLPAAIAPMIEGIGGLSDLGRPGAALHLHSLGAGGAAKLSHGPGQFVTITGSQQQLFVGSDLTQAYNAMALFPQGAASGNHSFASNEAIATILLSSYNETFQQDLPPFDPAVIAQYFNDTLPASWPAPQVEGDPVAIGGLVPPLPASFGDATDDILSEAENSLDLEMAGSMAPGALLANFYFAASLFESSSSVTYGDLADAFADCLATALDHDYGSHRLVAVTNSYGLPDLIDPLWDSELAHAAALGVTIIASSGDQGNAPQNLTGRPQGAGPGWPATVAFNDTGVLSVGGSSVTLNGLPTAIYDPLLGYLNVTFDTSVSGIANESVWYTTAEGPGGYAGSEGGISSRYAEPSWQVGSAAQPAIVNATLVAGDGALGRAVPDLAFNAEDMIAYTSANSTGTYFEVLSGTSVSSPLVAGLLATSAAVVGHPFGYLDPWLYRLGSYYAADPNATDPLRGIVDGENYLYHAAPGWNPVTGWGSVNAGLLPAALTDPAVSGYNYSGPTPGLPPRSAPHGAPSPPVAPLPAPVWAVALVAAGVMVVALYLAIRFEGPTPTPPPPGAIYPPGSEPREVAERPKCAACGRELAPWLAVCPWCGTQRR